MREPDSLESILKTARRDLDELKTRQLIGSGNIVNYKTSTSNEYDYTFHFDSGEESQLLRLMFTHATAARGGLFNLKVFYNAGLPDTDVLNNSIPPWANGPDVLVAWREEMPPSVGNTTSWIIQMLNGTVSLDPVDVYLKFFIDGTDTGSWSLTEL